MGYVVCGGCSARIPPSNWNQDFALPCPVCAREVMVTVFPVALRPLQPPVAEPVVTGEEAGCYDHPGSRATAACDNCGRFVCALCAIENGGGHLCPSCFDRQESPAQHERVNFDSIALATATLPMIFCWLPVITTPVALFFSFKYWNAPAPVFPRSHWRQWVTVLVAILQAGAVGWFIWLVSVPRLGGLPPG